MRRPQIGIRPKKKIISLLLINIAGQVSLDDQWTIHQASVWYETPGKYYTEQ